MAEKEKKQYSVSDAVGEMATIIVVLLLVSFLLGRITLFIGDLSDRVNVALGNLPVGETPVGDVVVLSEEVEVFDDNGDSIGMQDQGVSGSVIKGPIFRDGERYWYVDFLSGKDGWVKESALRGERGRAFSAGDTPVGTTVTTVGTVRVFEEPGTGLLGVVSASSDGRVVGGPIAKDGIRYWYVDFDTDPDGWVAEGDLRKTDGSAFNPGGTPIGKEVSTRGDIDMYRSLPGDTVSKKEGVIGIITNGPIYHEGKRYWYVDFDTDPDGWVAEGDLTPTPLFKPGGTPVGTRTETVSGTFTTVHDTPNGVVVFNKTPSTSGFVIGGPVYAGDDVWWLVAFDDGTEGWVSEDTLRKEGGASFTKGATPVGEETITGVNSVVRDTAGGAIVGGQVAGQSGMVVRGPIAKDGIRYWYVDFDTDPDGWVAEGDLRKIDGSAFNPGDTPVGYSVLSKRNTLVYNDAGSEIGTQKADQEGVIERGPIARYDQRYWYVNFEKNPDGWVAEADLMSYAPPSFFRRVVSRAMSVLIVGLWVLTGVLVVSIGVVVMRINTVVADLNASIAPKRKEDVLVPEKNAMWNRVLSLSESDNPSDWKLSIIEADAMLDRMLRGMGYPGDTIGDRLKAVERSDFTTLDDAWEAHKVRNRIAHEGGDFLITGRETRRIIQLYKRVFEEFRLI